METCNKYEELGITENVEEALPIHDSEGDVRSRRWPLSGRRRAGSERVEVQRYIGAVEEGMWSRLSGMTFHVADVKKPLASAAKVVEAGNRVVLDPNGCYIESLATGEKIALRKERGVFVIDVRYESGEEGTITLDSGAGVSVWPKDLQPSVKMLPRKEGLRMIAANGTVIDNIGQKIIRFQGLGFTGRS